MGDKAAAVLPCIAACCCFGSAFAVTLSLSLNYGSLLSRASEYDLAKETDGAYDLCGDIYATSADPITSGWT